MLPKNGKYGSWENTIDRLLGDNGWRTEFYKKDPQVSLFDLGLIDGSEDEDRVIKDASLEHIKEYIISRLETTFPCVSNNPRIFKNSKESTMFLFCFAISNESVAAQRLALRIAEHILKNK